MLDEHSLTSRQADQLWTDIANVEGGLEIIMEQVVRLPTRKESATQGDGLGDRDPGEDEGVRLKRPIDFFDGKAPRLA
jgi:predicted RNA-binding protein